jgi:drug/metabolite transporter (DMT)-like permease
VAESWRSEYNQPRFSRDISRRRAEPMIIEGVILGLAAAICQSLCYVFSRRFVTRQMNRSTALFALAHVQMGAMALAMLPLCYNTEQITNVRAYAWPLAGCLFFYLSGQLCLFRAVKVTDASRISPLLGLKLLVLSFTAVLLFSERITPLQWLAVGISLVAAVGLNYSGGGIPWRGLLAIGGACVAYAFSDLSIVAMTKVLAPHHEFKGILLGASLAYILSGGIGVALASLGPPEDRTAQKWKDALPVAVTWFAAMIFLFVCFRLLGAVFGNIVQSMRGPFSILFGAALAARGHVHLESEVSRWTLLRRLVAALLMCAAIALFAYERSRLSP